MAKQLVPRTRNQGTLTESAFWGMIRATLRNKTRFWKPKLAVLNAAKRKYTGPNKLQKWEFQCAKCKNWFLQKEVEIDHKIPCGSLTCAADLPIFVNNLFCEEDNLECLCKVCHKEKTAKQKQK